MNGLLVKGLWAAGMAVVFAAGSVSAEAAEITCEVPFEFVVNGTRLPAGSYHVSLERSVMLLRGYGVGGAVTLTDRLESRAEGDARLVFHKYGHRYILKEAWTGGRSGRGVPESAQERELKVRAASGMERVSVPAS